ncbi:MAG: hypothetical protein ACKO2C_02260 [Actinomycetes bacterium]
MTYPSAWSAANRQRVEEVAGEIRDARTAACAQVNFVDPLKLAPAVQRYGWRAVPGALGDCSFDEDETIEIGVFGSDSERDRFVEERTRSICRRAAAVQASAPPFAWVRAPGVTVQADTRSAARQVARAIDGQVDVRRCNLKDTLGWSRGGVERVRKVGAEFVNEVPCAALGLMDRDRFAPGESAAPAAVASCLLIREGGGLGVTGTVPDDDGARTVYVAAFDRRSQTSSAFARAVLDDAELCRTPRTLVIGDGWAIAAPTDVAAAVATATTGRVGPSCAP